MVSTAGFQHLANRPPTPPRDHLMSDDIDQALDFLDVDSTIKDLKQNEDSVLPVSSSTTHPSPPSSLVGGSEEGFTRKVEFSPCITKHEHGTPIAKGSPLANRSLSSKDFKPLKSILKSTLSQEILTPDSVASSAADYFSISDPATFPVMLESVLKLLASPTTSSRLDGYRTLNGAIKAYENLPHADAMRNKMSLLSQFLIRDIVVKPAKNDPTEANLTTQALKLTTALILTPALDNCFSNDFSASLLDQSIDVITREGVSKSIANHHMYFLASQKFSPKVMTPARAEQILNSLVTIHNRVSGNSVIAARLVIFRQLIDQAPQVMLTHIGLWLIHVFHALLSSVKDVRLRATETGMHAGLVLGVHSQATQALVEIFNTSTNDLSTYGAYLNARMLDMVSNKELASHVPQIWSLTILFFRSKKSRLLKWSWFKKSWLVLIQKCLNSSDPLVRYRANLAWIRLIFVVSPDKEAMKSMDSIVQMLKIPYVAAFDKKDRDKQGKEARQLAVSGYCHLLHYSLGPSQSWEELDLYWDAYVQVVLAKLLRAGPRDVALVSRVLKALLGGKPKVWDADLANNPTILGPEDLPRLDSAWVRSRIPKILDLIGPQIARTLSTPEHQGGIDKTPWRELLTAIAEAGSQEVRASVPLRETLAHLMNFFGRLWKDASRNFKEESDGVWITRFGELVQCAIEKLGALHFSEANLARTEEEDFEAAPTPSHRPSKHHVTLQSPMVFLFGLFRQPPDTVSGNTDFFRVAKHLLHEICQGKLSRKAKLQLLRQCSDSISRSPNSSPPSTIEAKLWSVLAQELVVCLTNNDSDLGVEEPERLGTKARDMVHMLTVGLDFCAMDADGLFAWGGLYDTAMNVLRQESGEGAVVLGLMEPVAEALSKASTTILSNVIVQLTSALLANSAWPKNRQQLEDGRKALSNSSLVHTRHTIFEPFVHVLSLVKSTLQQSYEELEQCKSPLPLLVEAVSSFLQQCPSSQLPSTLRRMQEGLAALIGDGDRLIVHSDSSLHEVSIKTVSLWQTILRLLRPLPSNITLLKALDVMFAAGLNSSHRAIVNATVAFWNDTFGQLDALTYPPKVELALRRVQPLVELDLPTFPTHEMDLSPLGDFIDSQVAEESDSVETPSKKRDTSRLGSSRPRGATPARLSAFRNTPTRTVHPVQKDGSSTPRQRVSRSTTKAKLRHEDSQVQFVPVQVSSPISAEDESQLLTDRQKEVIARQHFETAQMYPDFSSSPAPRSASTRSRMPRLDFSAQKVALEDFTTPDEHGLMDDYMGSSPTPKAAQKSVHSQSVLRETTLASHEEDLPPSEDVEDSDLPSSPPEMPEDADTGYMSDADKGSDDQELYLVALDGTKVEEPAAIDDIEEPLIDTNANEDESPESNSVQLAPVAELEAGAHDSDDAMEAEATAEATAELQHASKDAKNVSNREPASGEEISNPLSNVQETEIFVDAPTEFEINAVEENDRDGSSSPIQFTDSLADVHSTEDASQDTQDEEEALDSARKDDDITESSHVEDLFLPTLPEHAIDKNTPAQVEDPLDEASPKDQTSSIRRNKRKRRAPQTSVTPAKRRKQNSPMKRIFSWVTGSQEQDSDSDGDCIALGSQPERRAPDLEDTPVVSASAPASVDASTSKRRRGRPRKPESPVISTPSGTARTRQLKRNASVLSTASAASAVVDTPEPRKSRRVTRSQDAISAEAEPEVEAPRTFRRTAEAVVIPISERKSAKIEKEEEQEEEEEVEEEKQKGSDDEDSDEGPESQLRTEQAEASQRERVIAKPKSIIERLKGILSDCKTMVLGSQEHRELHAVLFEVGMEVHEAANRGRS